MAVRHPSTIRRQRELHLREQVAGALRLRVAAEARSQTDRQQSIERQIAIGGRNLFYLNAEKHRARRCLTSFSVRRRCSSYSGRTSDRRPMHPPGSSALSRDIAAHVQRRPCESWSEWRAPGPGADRSAIPRGSSFRGLVRPSPASGGRRSTKNTASAAAGYLLDDRARCPPSMIRDRSMASRGRRSRGRRNQPAP